METLTRHKNKEMVQLAQMTRTSLFCSQPNQMPWFLPQYHWYPGRAELPCRKGSRQVGCQNHQSLEQPCRTHMVRYFLYLSDSGEMWNLKELRTRAPLISLCSHLNGVVLNACVRLWVQRILSQETDERKIMLSYNIVSHKSRGGSGQIIKNIPW